MGEERISEILTLRLNAPFKNEQKKSPPRRKAILKDRFLRNLKPLEVYIQTDTAEKDIVAVGVETKRII